MSNGANIMSFEDGLDINIGENAEFKITSGDPCECPDSLFEIIPSEIGECSDKKAVFNVPVEFNCGTIDSCCDELHDELVTVSGYLQEQIDDCCASGSGKEKAIAIFHEDNVLSGYIVGLNGSDPIVNQPYLITKKYKINKVKFFIGSSNYPEGSDANVKVNIYEVALNGPNGYSNDFANIHHIDPSVLNLLTSIDIDISELDSDGIGTKVGRFKSIDLNIEGKFNPAAVLGNIIIKDAVNVYNIWVWIYYEDIEE